MVLKGVTKIASVILFSPLSVNWVFINEYYCLFHFISFISFVITLKRSKEAQSK